MHRSKKIYALQQRCPARRLGQRIVAQHAGEAPLYLASDCRPLRFKEPPISIGAIFTARNAATDAHNGDRLDATLL